MVRVGAVLGPGDVLYEGPAHMAAFGTTPFYGYALRMFPHCERSADHFQLRISAMEVPTVLNELPNLWTGALEHDLVQHHRAAPLEREPLVGPVARRVEEAVRRVAWCEQKV